MPFGELGENARTLSSMPSSGGNVLGATATRLRGTHSFYLLLPACTTSKDGCMPECSGMSLDAACYTVGSTTLVTTQRCLPILRSRMNPSF
jgi:hypothetical protein